MNMERNRKRRPFSLGKAGNGGFDEMAAITTLGCHLLSIGMDFIEMRT